jgi:DNA-binding NarL/FixJ family response regulator
LDVNLSNVRTVDALTAARKAFPASYFAIILASETRAGILAALAAGLHGFISKHQSDADILDAITNLSSGRIYVPCSIGAASDSSVSQGDEEGASFLSTEVDLSKRTKRQREVFPLLVQGLSNKEIARALEIAEATTKIHLAALLRTLGVRNRTEAADKADYVVNLTGSTDAEGRGDKLDALPLKRAIWNGPG